MTPPPTRTAARTAGGGLLVMAVLAATASAAVLGPLTALPAGDVAGRIATAPLAFHLAVLAFAGVAVLDVVVARALRVVLAPGGALLADVAAALRVTYAGVLLVAVGHLALAGRVAGRAAATGADGATAGAEVATFDAVWSLGLGVFALHLLAVAALAAGAPGVPRVVAAAVAVAGVGYLVDAVTDVTASGAGTSLVSVAFVGEVVLMGWLLVVGFRPDRAVRAPVTAA